MKESASHLVSRARTVNERDRERESFFQWLNEFTSRMPRQNWRNFQMQSIQLAMTFTPADSPSKSTRVLLLHPTLNTQCTLRQDQHQPLLVATWRCYSPSHSKGEGAGGGGGGPNPHQMVSNFLLYFFFKVFTLARNDFCFMTLTFLFAHRYVMFGFCH